MTIKEALPNTGTVGSYIGSIVDSGCDRLLGRVDGPVGWLIFNNPAKRNAISLDMWEAVTRLLTAFEADAAIRVVILAGAGGQAFISGADLTQYNKLGAADDANQSYALTSRAARAAISAFTKPLIAMIDGFCLGAGVLIASLCDVRIASDRSVFGIPAARLGLGYGLAGVEALAAIIGPAAVKDLLFSARKLDAAEALRIGLVSQIWPADDLQQAVQAYAGTVAANAPLTLRAAKITVREMIKPCADRDDDAVSRALEACLASDDYREGRAAFAEKRPPRFKGR